MKNTEQRIKIALQKNGRLAIHSLDLLRRCGLQITPGKDELFCYGENMPIDILLVRDDDIPGLLNDNVCELGIAGLNIVEEKRFQFSRDGDNALFDPVQPLDFGHCKLAIAAPNETEYKDTSCLDGQRIATSYPAILSDFLVRHSIDAEIVNLSGAVEIAPKLGKADFICDLVSTGATLLANQLREVHTIMKSEAMIVQTGQLLSAEKQAWTSKILQRISGVLQVRECKYVMLHAPKSALDEIVGLLPGSEAPTILQLDGADDKVAVHSVCRENVFWETLENLKRAGASSLLVLPIEKMLV